MTQAPNKRNAVGSLTDNVLVDILSRLPARSLCCCMCVCRSWKCVISDLDHRKKLSQTVAGFFYGSWWTGKRHFTSITEEEGACIGVEIYSSKTAAWIFKESEWDEGILSVWILEDYGTTKWRLKHVVSTQELFGQFNIEVGTEICDADYRLIIVHPE
ncbi:uncharacterized protein [Miscanthus floridulus]|uniref:uncharacterized protein n=1 Tax=Miscanthus floridulus TaxID=154761 RepID=UPI003459AC82